MPGRCCNASRLIGRPSYGNRASNACEEQYRLKARQSSRLSLKPEPSSCQSRRRRHHVRCEARKAEEAPRRNCRPQNGELRRGLPPLAPRPTEVRGMIRPTRIPSTLTPGEAQTVLAARPTHYTQAHHGELRYGRRTWPTGEKGHLREIGAQGFPQSPNIYRPLSSGWVGRGKAEADDGRAGWPWANASRVAQSKRRSSPRLSCLWRERGAWRGGSARLRR
jgi:hypothetical protein